MRRKQTTHLSKRAPSVVQKRHIVGWVVGASAAATGLAGSAWLSSRYRVCNPDQYLVRTGLGINDILVSKKGIQWPFQKASFIGMKPNNYSMKLDAMSQEKMEFLLPGVFTIGPKDDNESLQRYAKILLSFAGNGEDDHLHDQFDCIVKGVIEGETRVLAAQMTIEEIFNNRSKFKDTIIKNVQDELNQFGLWVYNANVKELQDASGSEYFQYRRQKTRSEAEGSAKVDIAEAKKNATVGEKDRDTTTRIKTAEYEARAIAAENEAQKAIQQSTAEYNIVAADADRRSKLAQIEAEKATKMRDAELQRKVEELRVLEETERIRAADYARADVDAQVRQRIADADLYAKSQEAEGIRRTYYAQADGLERMVGALGGDTNAFMQYYLAHNGVYDRLAERNAQAIQGLNPKITVWNTTQGNDHFSDTIHNIGKMIPPIFDTIYQQVNSSKKKDDRLDNAGLVYK